MVPALGALLASSCSDDLVSRAIGARCDKASECEQRCLAPSEDSPGGFCTIACDSDRDCPDDARCVDQDDGVCLFSCGADADCTFLGAGWRCRSRDAQPGPNEVMVCRGD